MKFLSSFCRHDSRHRHAFHRLRGVESKEGKEKDEQDDEPNLSPITLGSDSTYANSFGESGNSLTDAELQTPNTCTKPCLETVSSNLPYWQPSNTDPKVHSNDSDQDVVTLAQVHFHRGCELWAQDDFVHALEELEVSRAIWEGFHPHLLLLMQPSMIHNSTSTSTHNVVTQRKHLRIHSGQPPIHHTRNCLNHDVEAVAQLYYALGMVHLSLTNHKDALKEFRRALQVALLGLGKDHYLVGASTYMIRMSLLIIGYASPKIHLHIRLFVGEINKERKADKLWKHGKIVEALDRYAQLDLLYDMDAQTCARVMTKIATLKEECGEYVIASELWSDILRLLIENLSLEADHPLVEQVKEKKADILKLQLERIEI